MSNIHFNNALTEMHFKKFYITANFILVAITLTKILLNKAYIYNFFSNSFISIVLLMLSLYVISIIFGILGIFIFSLIYSYLLKYNFFNIINNSYYPKLMNLVLLIDSAFLLMSFINMLLSLLKIFNIFIFVLIAIDILDLFVIKALKKLSQQDGDIPYTASTKSSLLDISLFFVILLYIVISKAYSPLFITESLPWADSYFWLLQSEFIIHTNADMYSYYNLYFKFNVLYILGYAQYITSLYYISGLSPWLIIKYNTIYIGTLIMLNLFLLLMELTDNNTILSIVTLLLLGSYNSFFGYFFIRSSLPRPEQLGILLIIFNMIILIMTIKTYKSSIKALNLIFIFSIFMIGIAIYHPLSALVFLFLSISWIITVIYYRNINISKRFIKVIVYITPIIIASIIYTLVVITVYYILPLVHKPPLDASTPDLVIFLKTNLIGTLTIFYFIDYIISIIKYPQKVHDPKNYGVEIYLNSFFVIFVIQFLLAKLLFGEYSPSILSVRFSSYLQLILALAFVSYMSYILRNNNIHISSIIVFFKKALKDASIYHTIGISSINIKRFLISILYISLITFMIFNISTNLNYEKQFVAHADEKLLYKTYKDINITKYENFSVHILVYGIPNDSLGSYTFLIQSIFIYHQLAGKLYIKFFNDIFGDTNISSYLIELIQQRSIILLLKSSFYNKSILHCLPMIYNSIHCVHEYMYRYYVEDNAEIFALVPFIK